MKNNRRVKYTAFFNDDGGYKIEKGIKNEFNSRIIDKKNLHSEGS